MKLFTPKSENVKIKVLDKEEYEVNIQWSILCFPVVLDIVEERFSNPSVDKTKSLMHYSTPNESLRAWWRCLFRKKVFIKRVLVPYLANCMYYEIEGEFANGFINYKES